MNTSIEAGIQLGGNGNLRAIHVHRHRPDMLTEKREYYGDELHSTSREQPDINMSIHPNSSKNLHTSLGAFESLELPLSAIFS